LCGGIDYFVSFSDNEKEQMKRNACITVFFLLCGGLVFGQNTGTAVASAAPSTAAWTPAYTPQGPKYDSNDYRYWYVLETGKTFFANGDYGSALAAFRDARDIKHSLFQKMYDDLIIMLSIGEVRRYGDDLRMVERFATERHQVEAQAALTDLYCIVPKSSLRNSVQNALAALKRLKYYPEADYWLGEIYRMEGEAGIAADRYRTALSHADALRTPEMAIEIRYKLASQEALLHKYNDMEADLRQILTLDKFWTSDSNGFLKNAMRNTFDNTGIDRFIVLYRYRNDVCEKAHRLLGSYYCANGRYARAEEQLLFSFLIQTTTVIEEYSRQDALFTFTTMEDLMNTLRRSPELCQYLDDHDYWRTLYYTGVAFYGCGKTKAANSCWAFLAGLRNDPDYGQGLGEWGRRAANQLQNPKLETPTAVENNAAAR
jgi:tetratricopeptide (TPR) repeat protein